VRPGFSAHVWMQAGSKALSRGFNFPPRFGTRYERVSWWPGSTPGLSSSGTAPFTKRPGWFYYRFTHR
jgi:hypothetical protein